MDVSPSLNILEKQILNWAKPVIGKAEPSKFQKELSGLFTGAQRPKKRGHKPKSATAARPVKKTRRKKKGRPEPKLETGTYVNPGNNETVQKIECAPRQLLEWVEKYGVDAVRSWRRSN